jgi:hypothetical protein
LPINLEVVGSVAERLQAAYLEVVANRRGLT